MPRALKVFEFDARIPGTKKYGRNCQVLVYVAATSQAAVAQLMGVTGTARLHNFRQACFEKAIKQCQTKPLTCFVKGINDYSDNPLEEVSADEIRR